MSHLQMTAYKVKALKTSAVTSFYINQLYDCAAELKRIDGNWYAKNNVQKVNEKALKALSQYNLIRDYYNQLEEHELIKSISDLENRIRVQPRNSILTLVEFNNLNSKLSDLKSIERLKKIFTNLPVADELINYLYSPVLGKKFFDDNENPKK